MLTSLCLQCGLAPDYCICGQLPTLSSPLAITLLTHTEEVKKASNSGRLAAAAIDNCEISLWQRKPPLQFAENSALLFPGDDAEVLDASSISQLQHIVILDASWQQAAKMQRQSQGLQSLSKRRLILPGVSQYRLRKNQKNGNFSTLECVAELLLLQGLPEQAAALLDLLVLFQRRYLQQQHHQLPSE